MGTDSHGTDTPSTDALYQPTKKWAGDKWFYIYSTAITMDDMFIHARQLERELAKVKAHEAKLILSDQRLHHENMRLRDQLSAASETAPTRASSLVKLLRQGASISRARGLNLDYAKVADAAADRIEILERTLVRILKKADPQPEKPEPLQPDIPLEVPPQSAPCVAVPSEDAVLMAQTAIERFGSRRFDKLTLDQADQLRMAREILRLNERPGE